MFMNHQTKKKKVIIGMSGGVDSSVAALLLQQHQYQVEGLFMKNWEEDDFGQCQAAKDLADAQKVCNQLGIPLHKVNFSAEYWDNVFSNFLDEYQSGRTPNPDILCNKKIKFKIFMEFATEELGANFIATGHYVRQLALKGQRQLLRGIDRNKDQSYFLYTLNQKQLRHSLFPIGGLTKNVVRGIANKYGLVTAKKKDSMGICFIGKKNFRNFISKYLPALPGNIITTDGQVIGKHQGLIYYTIGQRKGLMIGGTKQGNNEPWYVIDKKIQQNLLIVAQGKNHPHLMSVGLIAHQFHWLNRYPLNSKIFCSVKIRYRQVDVPCLLIPHDDKKIITAEFLKPIAAITPGQSAVFYWGEICLGGGIIEKRFPLKNEVRYYL
ncbi:MAG: tRNA 2-thiouridine(34) synthase MnmA [Candidatus Dasytiphilus stammeri]